MVKKLSPIVLGLLLVVVFASVAHAASTFVVTGDTSAGENQPGWLFNRDSVSAYEFNTDAASIGQGSLYVQPITTPASNKFIGENFLNTAIADVTSISYDFKIGPSASSTQEEQFYMNVYANFGESDPLKYYDCRYDVVPTVGSQNGFTTVTFDPTKAYPVTTRGGASASPHTCPAVPADMDTLSPGSRIRMFALNVGDTSANDVGVDGYLDNVVVTTTAGVTTYDFEPVLTPQTKDECKKGGWMRFNTPSFKNQGQCVSYVEHQKKHDEDDRHEKEHESDRHDDKHSEKHDSDRGHDDDHGQRPTPTPTPAD